jgi:hypothetical protein
MEFIHADEEWLELPSDSRYLVSTHGRLYDVTRNREVSRSNARGLSVPSWSVRNPKPGGSPNRYIKIAETVLATFEGPGEGVVYKDGDSENLALSNLAWEKKQPRRAGRRALAKAS